MTKYYCGLCDKIVTYEDLKLYEHTHVCPECYAKLFLGERNITYEYSDDPVGWTLANIHSKLLKMFPSSKSGIEALKQCRKLLKLEDCKIDEQNYAVIIGLTMRRVLELMKKHNNKPTKQR